MPADVVETTNLPVFAAHGDDGLAEKIKAVVIADGRDVVQVAQQLPAAAEYMLLFELEEFRVVVDPRRKAECGVLRGGWAKCGVHGLLNDRKASRAVTSKR